VTQPKVPFPGYSVVIRGGQLVHTSTSACFGVGGWHYALLIKSLARGCLCPYPLFPRPRGRQPCGRLPSTTKLPKLQKGLYWPYSIFAPIVGSRGNQPHRRSDQRTVWESCDRERFRGARTLCGTASAARGSFRICKIPCRQDLETSQPRTFVS
jgi:hypothetical protein